MTIAPTSRFADTRADRVHGPDERIVDVGGERLLVSVRRPGVGTPLLLINGIGASVAMWNPFRNLLERETIAFDAPGTGRSSGSFVPRTMRGLGRITEQLLDELGYDQVDVLGVSFGGGIAQYLTIQAPERVRRLVLACTVFGAGSLPGRPTALVHMMNPLRYRSSTYLDRVSGSLYGGALARRGHGIGLHGWSHTPPTVAGYASQVFASSTWFALPHLARIPHETLVLAGGDDPLVPAFNARVMGKVIPRSTVHVIPHAGHLLLFEQAPEAVDIVSRFLDR
jgi:pimeloyl-ACP methyl ester carboxylesterase